MKPVVSSKNVRMAVLGDGGWGTTLAVLLCRKGFDTILWGAFPDYVDYLKRKRENKKFLPGIKLSGRLRITSGLDEAIEDRHVIIAAVPSHFMRSVCKQLGRIVPPAKRMSRLIISCSKGIEPDSLMRMSQVIEMEMPGAPVAALSGPSHAEEVVRESPATVVVASRSREAAAWAQELLMTERFRVYTNPDLIGVEIGGAVKNIIAIAAGACDGLGFGDNAKAALITRGIVEITRLGVSMGARAGTFAGLAGIGDLIATCVSGYGRNRKVGELIAKGKTLKQVLASMEMVAEGILTTKAARKLAALHGVEMPITEQAYAVLYKRKDPAAAVRELMMRSPKPEMADGTW